jgi:ribulose-phosphate 3-epimerase
MYIIAPSILSADFCCLGDEVDAILRPGGADWLHFDVMDRHYVPNLTLGPMVCAALKKRFPTLIIDVHLMVKPVDALIVDFIKAGANYISFHPEASEHLHRSLCIIKEAGLEAGLALNPSSSICTLDPLVLNLLDYLLLMSVNPGFSGQSLVPGILDKIKRTKYYLDSHQEKTGQNILIQVDGGVNMDNIREIYDAGARIFVAGSAIFGAKNKIAAIQQLRSLLP